MQVKRNKIQPYYFIEQLTVVSWLFCIFPFIVKIALKQERVGARVYFFDTARSARIIAKVMLKLLKSSLEKLEFRLVDIKDENRLLLRLRIAYFDFSDIQNEIISKASFRSLCDKGTLEKGLGTFLAKRVTHVDLWSNDTLWRAQLITQIAVWKLKKEKTGETKRGTLFLNKRLWMEEIKNYGLKYGIKIVPAIAGQIKIKPIFVSIMGSKIKVIQSMYYYIKEKGLLEFIKKIFSRRFPFSRSFEENPASFGNLKDSSVKLAAEYLNHFNLDDQGLNSDLFFWQQSELSAKDILLIFNNSKDPLDEQKRKALDRYGINYVALSPGASIVKGTDIFYHWLAHPQKKSLPLSAQSSGGSGLDKWFRKQAAYYSAQYNYWFDFFSRYNIKLYMSWFKYDSNHCIITDALRDCGGINTVYQRAFEEFPAPETITFSDIVFGFSRKGLELEKRSNSTISYYVVTGYFGDYRFFLLRTRAKEIRDKLKSRGARNIIAFFDENSADDARWHTGHEFMRDNYDFLLRKLLNEPSLGLVLKPKVPSTLRKRLGPLAELLKAAQNTGRCFIFEEGLSHGSYPPAAASLASDVAIHGHLCAATAGLESALAGVPTLLIDREGWPVSSLYKLGEKVVFTDWSSLWRICQDHWRTPGGVPGFGDWSLMLEELDPFRDGHAAQRIGTYLQWLLEGFKSGLKRDEVLAQAACRYAQTWGKDKVFEFKGTPFSEKLSNGDLDKVLVKSPGEKFV